MKKFRVLCIFRRYPQVSHTYIKSELEALEAECDFRIITMEAATLPYKNHRPFEQVTDPARLRAIIAEFQPHVLHSHWLIQAEVLGPLARQTGVPFTIRAHSFDSIWFERPRQLFGFLPLPGGNRVPPHLRSGAPFVNDELCLGVLAFPFTRPMLEKAGVRGEKIVDSLPVVNYRAFHDRGPNGDGVMNVGACIPKKQMRDFLELAARARGPAFNLYAMGHEAGKIGELNEQMSRPVNLIAPVEPEQMPREHKKHRWLVYTASRAMKTVGWPLSVAEAQAAGVGVLMPNIRPDLREYVGPCGFLYDSIAEAAEIISRPFPQQLRQQAFEHAKKSDIWEHKILLTRLWEKAAPRP